MMFLSTSPFTELESRLMVCKVVIFLKHLVCFFEYFGPILVDPNNLELVDILHYIHYDIPFQVIGYHRTV